MNASRESLKHSCLIACVAEATCYADPLSLFEPVLAALSLLAVVVAVCHAASLDMQSSQQGTSVDAEIGRDSDRKTSRREGDFVMEARAGRPRDEDRDYYRGKRKHRFSLNRRNGNRRHGDRDEDEDSLWDCDDLVCTLEWVLQYVLDTVSYPVRRLTV